MMHLYLGTVGINYTLFQHSHTELLALLYRYRQLTDPVLLKVEDKSPALGIYMGLYNTGIVRVGDSIFVGDE